MNEHFFIPRGWTPTDSLVKRTQWTVQESQLTFLIHVCPYFLKEFKAASDLYSCFYLYRKVQVNWTEKDIPAQCHTISNYTGSISTAC